MRQSAPISMKVFGPGPNSLSKPTFKINLFEPPATKKALPSQQFLQNEKEQTKEFQTRTQVYSDRF